MNTFAQNRRLDNFYGEPFKVISFNLRRDTKHDYLNSWKYRKEIAAKYIKNSGASIIGVQELLPSMKIDLKEMLRNYSIFGTGRFSGRKWNNDEHSDIITKDDSATVFKYRTFWLSKHPNTISRVYFSVFPRICTVAEVYLKDSGRRIRVFNTHFDHVSWLARSFSVKLILKMMHEYNQKEYLPSILMGDLNTFPGTKPIKILQGKRKEYSDINLKNVYEYCDSVINTHHGFKGKVKKRPIDYMFVTDDFDVLNVDIDTSCFDGRYPSDHYPLVADLRLKNCAVASAM